MVFSQLTATEQAKLKLLLSQMTIEEKVGQMTQVTIGLVAGTQEGTIDPQKLKDAIVNHKVGSLLNVANRAITQEEWIKLITRIQDETKNTRLKIPILYGLDGMHGQTYTLNSTLFPHNIALAATRNDEIVKRAARTTALELRACGVRWNFAPVLDIGRQPLWSRFPETFGEDVYIGRRMGVAAIQSFEQGGLKNADAVASCMKHYLGYSASRTGKDRTPIYLSERELREYYLPQFRDAIKAGSASIMINSSEINGTPVHGDYYLLTQVLRKEMGFKGVAVSDWEDVIRLHNRHFVAASPLDAVVMAVNAGVDMSMVPLDYSFYDLLLEAVKLKKVSIQRIDEAVMRILEMKMKLGLFDNPYPEKNVAIAFGRPVYQDYALEAARESITLLKNERNILPLDKSKKYLVAGPGAQTIAGLNGAWSYTWQGKDEAWYPEDSKTITEALVAELGEEHIIQFGKKGFSDPANTELYSFKAASKAADVIILCLGEDAYAESPGNIRDLALDSAQQYLALSAIETGKPIILVLTEGRPRLISNIVPNCMAVVQAYWGGRKAAEAITDVVTGKYNPSGRLPYSYPRSMGEMVLYDRKPTEEFREIHNENLTMDGYDPLFAFGTGLSYTSFQYSPLQLSTKLLKKNQIMEVRLTVTNTGKLDGAHSVELYSRDMYASVTPNVKRLRGYQKIFLKAGESKEVVFKISSEDLAFVNASLKTVTEPGEFKLMIGDQEAGFRFEN